MLGQRNPRLEGRLARGEVLARTRLDPSGVEQGSTHRLRLLVDLQRLQIGDQLMFPGRQCTPYILGIPTPMHHRQTHANHEGALLLQVQSQRRQNRAQIHPRGVKHGTISEVGEAALLEHRNR